MRVVRFVRPLRLLLLSISKSTRALFWAAVLILAVLMCFGFLFGQAVLDYCRVESAELLGETEVSVVPKCSDAVLEESWASVAESMLTLFLTATGGISYGDVLFPLFDVSIALPLLLLMYAFFMVFCILNVVTGIFCQVAFENAMTDKENVVLNHMVKRQDNITALREVFNEMDTNQDGLLSEEEFEAGLLEPRVEAYFESVGMDTHDAFLLFRIVDDDKTGEIDVDEFISGCTMLRGPATGFHIAKVRCELTASRRQQKQICKQSELLRSAISELGTLLAQSVTKQPLGTLSL